MQKTAYEMRISDWSSDVCSSDLIRHRQWSRVHAGRDQPAVPDRRCHSDRGDAVRWDPAGERRHVEDRKSVVLGKSVSVRVDLGGRRSINKNKPLDKLLPTIDRYKLERAVTHHMHKSMVYG